MNAGAYKSDMGYIIESVKVLTPDYKVIILENKEMNFHYRSSYLQSHPGYICLEVILKLQKGKKEAIEEVISERNPENNYAGKLIEDLGLKGLIKGGAMISDKHANFIVNYKDAESDDIKYLIDLCSKKVYDEYKIELKCEQEFVNWE